MKKDKICHAYNSNVYKNIFQIEPKEKNTNKMIFQMFRCGNPKNPSLTITYNSIMIIGNVYIQKNKFVIRVIYDLEGVKAYGEFQGDFLIKYSLYSNDNENLFLDS